MTFNKSICFFILLLFGCNQARTQVEQQTEISGSEEMVIEKPQFSLNDFYSENNVLGEKVDDYYANLSDRQRVAQMIITCAGELGKPKSVVRKLVSENTVGGVIFLKGEKQDNTNFIHELNALQGEHIPLLYSIDAEPSLYNRRVMGSNLKIKKTIEINTVEESAEIAHLIDQEIIEMGFRQNFAPVVDLSPNNEAITNRSYGVNPDTVVAKAKAFIEATQKDGVIATAKHFPGHGYVKGDTHKQSVYIDGEMKEVDVYKPLIEAGVLSIMVGHITIRNNEKYNTNDLPATCSKRIVTDLLKDEMGFRGIVITDAMNIMKAVTEVDNSPLLAVKAGCDIILMPPNETQLVTDILNELQSDEELKSQIEASVKKIIRMKICLGLLN